MPPDKARTIGATLFLPEDKKKSGTEYARSALRGKAVSVQAVLYDLGLVVHDDHVYFGGPAVLELDLVGLPDHLVHTADDLAFKTRFKDLLTCLDLENDLEFGARHIQSDFLRSNPERTRP